MAAKPFNRDFWALRDDYTEIAEIKEAHKAFISKIFDVYMFDKNTHTFCCSAEANYWMRHLYTGIEFVEGTPDDIRDELQQEYCYCTSEPGHYMLCSTVDAIVTNKVQYDPKGEEEQVEADVAEYWSGNCPF